GSMTQDDVDSVFHYLENVTLNDPTMGIVEMDSTYFGPIPDELDNDPKVIFFFSALGSFAGSVFDGYFSHFNQLTELEAQLTGDHSNECEMLYMSCHPVDPTSYINLSVLTHELQHLIHFGLDENEETWLNEGCSEYAMVLFGMPDPITQFPSEPNDNLISWDQHWSDYVQTMLFTTYLAEQTSGPAFITQLVANPLNSVASIDNTLISLGFSISFTDIFIRWTIANYINDTSVLNGIYGYSALDLPVFNIENYATNLPFSHSNNLDNCAAHYFKLSDSFTNNLNIKFTFSQGSEWALNLIAYEGQTAKEVIPFTGDSISFAQPSSYSLDKLILVVTNTEVATSDKDYSFEIDEGNPFEITSVIADENNFEVYPNPVTQNSTIYLSLKKEDNVLVDVFSSDGKLIKNIISSKLKSGNHSFNLNIPELKQGVYFITLKTDNRIATKRIVVVE
ncbi:MAG: T9SS type A sorting domain-containing protein, partial [Bacteroidota bacterium]|nr:T9SS type A sorting domain-containing protein [Bacteroidota bacterium]